VRSPFKLGLALLLCLAISPSCLSQVAGQNPTQPTPGMPSPGQMPPSNSPDDQGRERLEKEMQKKANEDREAQLRRDTDRLLKLATELKNYVDKTNQDTLSVNVVKKAEEIEKLAKSVKEKMKGN